MSNEANDLIAELEARRIQGAANEKHAEIAEKLKNAILERNSRFNAKELKKFEVTHFADNDTLTFVTIEVGMFNDEGTAASILCRDHRHISIGKKGGVTLMNAKNQHAKNRGFWNCVHSLVR